MWDKNYSLATCTPKTCASLGKNCGIVPDGCHGTLDCGTCSTGSCGGGGTANVCSSANSYLSTGGTVSASNPNTGAEDMTKAFDQNISFLETANPGRPGSRKIILYSMKYYNI
jgi:hypothetical protein